jgi:hypothetical protein
MTFNFNNKTMEFEEKPSGMSLENWETGDISGNRVFVTGMGAETRFRVDINDCGHVIAAFNRLVRKFIPTFQPF